VENVVRNAIRYTKPQTGVIIALNKVNGAAEASAHLLVADHGHGVPPESLSRLFEPFYRVSESRESRSCTEAKSQLETEMVVD
jgi:two-component system sensor histidine kinase CpxA